MAKNLDDYFQGFSKLTRHQRLERLVQMGALTLEDVAYLEVGGLTDPGLGEKLIENVVGYFQLPLGIATNFRIDKKDYVIPMAVEETSIVAAASKTARWVRDNGEIFTDVKGANIIGQIQFAKTLNFEKLSRTLAQFKDQLISRANIEVASGLVRRGGGVREMQIRRIDRDDGHVMAVIHVLADPCEAMGANIMNQVCEFLKGPLMELTGETVSMCILSNLVDTKLTKATVCLRHIDAKLAEDIEEASLFAELDPYRAATNNKGVLNGMDPIVIATGNDWRAVEAGVHAYSVRDGAYRSITQWKREGTGLVGTLTAPIITGTVGGVTTLHPTAKMCLRMLGSPGANELSRVIAAVGLVQNLGALKALTTVGIIEGHMKLHIKNLSLGAGASEEEMPHVERRLEQILVEKKRISMTHAKEALAEVRDRKSKEDLAAAVFGN